jgi:hypothetical protein
VIVGASDAGADTFDRTISHARHTAGQITHCSET